jgi:hypothetical protein
MKNIHVLPTDKPSRLYQLKNDILRLDYKIDKGSANQNIYITSDEEIKEGDYFWKPDCNMIFKAEYTPHKGCEKVILTTDQDLIKDGVQAIDDEFLEWFIKNPSCEEVKVEEEDYSQKCRECGEVVKRGYSCNKGCFMKSGNFIPTDKNIKYKIIIPKEEPKQETLEEAIKKYKSIGLDGVFKEGVKWQQKRSYSEEDIINALHSVELKDNKDYSKIYNGMKEWFEQFKNK